MQIDIVIVSPDTVWAKRKKKKEINIVFLSVLRIQHLNVGSFTAVNKKGKAWSQIPIGNINLSAVLM